jgi:glycosyltransferase involved in cell wall biosynthesis
MGVVKAFEILKEKYGYEGSLILAGMPGSGFEILNNYVDKSKCKDDIYITGYVKDEELVALYSRCDVFCFLSLYEGFGIPPLEALACEAKVVVSNTSSLPEVVGDCGITVSPYAPDEVAKKIHESINDIYRVEKNKINEHLLNFDWRKLSEKFVSILNNC